MSKTGFASYADKNTPYASGDSIDNVLKSHEDDYMNLSKQDCINCAPDADLTRLDTQNF